MKEVDLSVETKLPSVLWSSRVLYRTLAAQAKSAQKKPQGLLSDFFCCCCCFCLNTINLIMNKLYSSYRVGNDSQNLTTFFPVEIPHQFFKHYGIICQNDF